MFSDSALESITEIEVNLIRLSLSVDTDHLACVFLVGEAYKAAVLADGLSDKFWVSLVRGLLFHESSIFRVVESSGVRVDRSLLKFLDDRFVTLFEDYDQLRDEL
jgi:hypothetical protein